MDGVKPAPALALSSPPTSPRAASPGRGRSGKSYSALKQLLEHGGGWVQVAGKRTLSNGAGQLRFRSVCWKVFLGVLHEKGDAAGWVGELEALRGEYSRLKAEMRIDPHLHVGSRNDDHPLNQNAESTWLQALSGFDDKQQIVKDLQRTFVQHHFFEDSLVQESVIRLLTVWCKAHNDGAYWQGMTHVLAPIYHVLQQDVHFINTIPPMEGALSAEEREQAVGLFGCRDPEAELYILFTKLMTALMPFYNETKAGAARKGDTVLDKAWQLLQEKDPALHAHLTELQVEPHMFALRWVLLLLGQEFELEPLMMIWDALFAHSSNLGLLPFFVVSMLVSVRNELLDATDPGVCLLTLQHYPKAEICRDLIRLSLFLNELDGPYIDLPPPAMPTDILDQSAFGGEEANELAPHGAPAATPLSQRLRVTVQWLSSGVHTLKEARSSSSSSRSYAPGPARGAHEAMELKMITPRALVDGDEDESEGDGEDEAKGKESEEGDEEGEERKGVAGEDKKGAKRSWSKRLRQVWSQSKAESEPVVFFTPAFSGKRNSTSRWGDTVEPELQDLSTHGDVGARPPMPS